MMHYYPLLFVEAEIVDEEVEAEAVREEAPFPAGEEVEAGMYRKSIQ